MITNSSVEMPVAGDMFTAAGRTPPQREAREPESVEERAAVVAEQPEQSGQAKEAGEPVLDKKTADRIANDLERVMSNTQVQFRVLNDNKGGALNFAIVDRETGEVVREFPPRTVRELTEKGSLESGHGLLVDKPA